MIQEIYLIDDDKTIKDTLKELFKSDRGYRFTNVPESKLDAVLKNIPLQMFLYLRNAFSFLLEFVHFLEVLLEDLLFYSYI